MTGPFLLKARRGVVSPTIIGNATIAVHIPRKVHHFPIGHTRAAKPRADIILLGTPWADAYAIYFGWPNESTTTP